MSSSSSSSPPTPVPHIFVVDDDKVNRMIICEYLREMPEAYHVEMAVGGADAWQQLEKDPAKFDVILLDRMMPDMDGMEVLRRIKAHPVLLHLPVIFQTALASKEDIAEGMRAGAHYYLTKPFEEEVLQSVVRTAVHDRMEYRRVTTELSGHFATMSCLTFGKFAFKTIAEARSLAVMLASACGDKEKSVVGLTELLINAVEHGNLGISYDEKGRLNNDGTLFEEIDRRLALDENKHKEVKVVFSKNNTAIHITIKDEGEGFDWEPYLHMCPDRALDNHGRGIAMAGLLSFDKLEYQGCGNTVKATINLN